MNYFESVIPEVTSESFGVKNAWFWGAATLSALLGVKHWKEIVGAMLAHVVAWLGSGKGPSVIYNFLTGIRLQRREYMTTVVPLLVDLKDLPMGTNTNFAHGISLVLGFVASLLKLV